MNRRVLAVLVLLFVACAADPTQLVILVDSDMRVPGELDSVALEVTAPDGTTHDAQVSLSAGEDLPRTLVLLHSGGALGPVTIVARGLHASAPVVERRASAAFVSGQTRMIRIELLRECVGVSCAAGETCAAGGCRVETLDPSELLPWTGTPPALPDSDGAMPDAGPDAGPDGCVATSETCNGVDDNCDGTIDEGFDLDNDPANCGACGTVCPDGLHASGRCEGGSCALTCATGFFDCNRNPADGCEADLSTPASCGACGVVCDLAFATEACGSRVCAVESCNVGHADCDGLTGNGCETSTHALSSCGSCTHACPADPPHAASACGSGICELTCDPGFADCDSDASNGCETDLSSPSSCGVCGATCSAPTPNCVPGSSGFACSSSCGGLTDCGGTCADVTVDPGHCGTCATICPDPAHASPTCAASACEFVCDPGFADCNTTGSDGCEVDLSTLSDCGGCGDVCAPTHAIPSCSAGSCAVAACDAGFGDCNGSVSDGCETDLTTAAACGVCGRACTGATPDCVGGSCVPHVDGVVEVALGTDHACARRLSGAVACWGRNDKGQLGIGGLGDQAVPIAVAGLTGASRISAGAAHTCAATVAGAAFCWGDNVRGQVGDGTRLRRDVPTRVLTAGSAPLTGILHVAAGLDSSCAVAGSGVYCWGRNNKGQLGDGTKMDRVFANTVSWPAMAGSPRGVDVGDSFACVLNDAGSVYCFGSNDVGQLGDGSTTDASSPVRVSGLVDAVEISAGASFACARRAGGEVVCWGDNRAGQLGDGTLTMRTRPVAVSGVASARGIGCGTRHACVLYSSGQAGCWGRGMAGELGDDLSADSPTPVTVLGLVDGLGAAAGEDFSCAWRTAGGVACWGRNSFGQLGDRTALTRTSPRPVFGLP